MNARWQWKFPQDVRAQYAREVWPVLEVAQRIAEARGPARCIYALQLLDGAWPCMKADAVAGIGWPN